MVWSHHALLSSLSDRLLFTQVPSSLQFASFSLMVGMVARPLVVVATKTRAPAQPASAVTPSSTLLPSVLSDATTPKFSDSSWNPYLKSFLVIFFPCFTSQTISQIPLPAKQITSGRH